MLLTVRNPSSDVLNIVTPGVGEKCKVCWLPLAQHAWVNTERGNHTLCNKVAEGFGVKPVYHYNELLPKMECFKWLEHAISTCPLGCKLYIAPTFGIQVLAHNSNYGCYR